MSHRLDNDPKRSLTIQILVHYPYVFDYFPQSNLNLYKCLASMLARAEVGEPTVPEPTCYHTEEESINFFTRYIADTRYILDQPSPSLVVVRVREKAHDAHDQLPMPGGMRRLWQHAWFTDPEQNAFAKVLNIDLEQVPVGFSIDTNTTMSAPYRPKYNSEHRIRVDEGQSELDADKVTRPTLLIRLPVPSN
ncbi:hypothetical protein C8035_v008093 [Colletotrichum spinosum]|uniref:Uncharacterized protein n=1 Tax=Colletotrichum spinosum TaxID=1347390 RepID=A0A4R8QKW9_9PEZI|nr:hypothetical protein C8035_v008093 [Colletotrichum spinosum]